MKDGLKHNDSEDFDISFLATEDVEQDKTFSPPSYMDAVQRSSEATRWFDFLTKGEGKDRASLEKRIFEELQERYTIPASFFGNITYYTEAVRHISGDDLRVPIIELTLVEYQEFLRVNDMAMHQGYSLQLPIENGMRSVSVVLVCKDQIIGQMSPEQIKQHEKIHAVDPLLVERTDVPDGLLLTEMISTIGEVSGTDLDGRRVITTPDFWKGYIRKIQGVTPYFLKTMRLTAQPDLNIDQVAIAISAFIVEITKNNNNTEIVKVMMNCKNFQELHDNFLIKMFPSIYQ